MFVLALAALAAAVLMTFAWEVVRRKIGRAHV